MFASKVTKLATSIRVSVNDRLSTNLHGLLAALEHLVEGILSDVAVDVLGRDGHIGSPRNEIVRGAIALQGETTADRAYIHSNR